MTPLSVQIVGKNVLVVLGLKKKIMFISIDFSEGFSHSESQFFLIVHESLFIPII